MRNNETGEFELVVGNRQLLSGFFIVVLLFAVAFAMGFVVGENSRSAKAQTEVAGAVPPATPPGEARPSASSPTPQPSAPTPTQPADSPQPAAEAPPQPTTQASRDVPAPAREVPAPTSEAPAPKHEAPPPVRIPPATHETKTPPTPAASIAPLVEAPPGSYWQVLATANRDSAQDMVRSLKDKGLPATVSPGPNNLTRVLVGPYHDNASLSRAKTELEATGLHPVRK